MTPQILLQLLIDPDKLILEAGNFSGMPAFLCAELTRLLSDVDSAAGIFEQSKRSLYNATTVEAIASHSLADVFASLWALHDLEEASISGEQLASLAKRLIAAEVATGGPYREHNGEIDPLANLYIAAYLQKVSVKLEPLLIYIDHYHESSVSDEDQMLWHILSESRNRLSSSHLQVLTSAIGVSLLQPEISSHKDDATTERQQLAQLVYAIVEAELQALQEPLREQSLLMLKKVQLNDNVANEISLLSWHTDRSAAISHKSLLLTLGAGNMYAWMAYTIYDDFLDGEGDLKQLGLANYAFRKMTELYQESLPVAFKDQVTKLFTTIEQANIKEVSAFRLPVADGKINIHRQPTYINLDLLADRALFHIIGPLAFAFMKYGDTESFMQHLQALRHYLIAKQLADDLQDWAEDLAAGHGSCVVTSILEQLHLPPGIYRLDRLMPQAQAVFWQTVLPAICTLAKEHLQQARQGLTEHAEAISKNGISYLLDKLEDVFTDALHQRQRTIDLLQHLF